MLRISSTPQSSPVPGAEIPDSSNWKPAFRRIHQSLFPSKKDGSLSSQDYASTPAASRGPQLNTNLQKADVYLTQTATVVSSGYTSHQVSTFAQIRTAGNREPLSSKALHYLKPSASVSHSRRKGYRQTGSEGGLLSNKVGNQELNQQEDTPYVPKHAASDFSKSTRQKPQEPTSSPSSIVPYTPKHAAADFSKLKVTAKSKIKMNRSESTAPPRNEQTTPEKTNDTNNDYQMFLATARASAARTYNTTGIISPNKPGPQVVQKNPQVAQKMKEIVAKHHETTRQRSISISQQSATSKPASILEKVGEYIKPSGNSLRTTLSDGQSSVRGSVTTPDRVGRKWSVRNPLSRNKDNAGDKSTNFLPVGEKQGTTIQPNLNEKVATAVPIYNATPVVWSPFPKIGCADRR